MKRFLNLLWLIFLPGWITAQILVPGKPAAWKFGENLSSVPVVRFTIPRVQKTTVQNNSHAPQPLRAGYVISTGKRLMQSGKWQVLPDGTRVWQIKIEVSGATALNLYFSEVKLKKSDRLFIYNAARQSLPGALSKLNNGKRLGTAYLPGNNLMVELDTRQQYDTLPFEIDGVGNITVTPEKKLKDFGDAGACEIPVNCPEGKRYKNQKNGVARILLRDGAGLFWCTGSLINDTKNDEKPYFLTANHCGDGSSASDYAQWVFYFNFESADCSRPAQKPAIHSLSGARLLAHADYNSASDFKLLLLNHKVPYDYKPYFNGWDHSGAVSDSGAVIHHPEGDIKMISTYKTPIRPVDYYGTVTDPGADFWEVHWASTVSGHGVTEGGSSGAPLFDSKGLVIGTLTGGDASCGTPDAVDYFGRFSKHWDGYGTDSLTQLVYWLDNAHTGAVHIPGFDPLAEHPLANFISDVNKTPPGGVIRFSDLSTGPVLEYRWEFEGGTPATYRGKTPPPVRYEQTGTYHVRLQVASKTESSTKIDSVFVLPVIYPNPTHNGQIHILLGSYRPSDIRIEIFDMTGRQLNTFVPQFGNDDMRIRLPHNQNGLYIIRLTNKNITHNYKVLNLHK
jgi:hypothetical protein